MKRIVPDDMYQGLPCSAVALGCALNASVDRLNGLISNDLHQDGYLSLDGMNRLIRANMGVKKKVVYKRGERPVLRDWAHEHLGVRAIICVQGHFIYYDGRDYHSFFWNGGHLIVCVWELE